MAALDRDEHGLAALERRTWGRVTVRPTDVSDPADVQSAFAQARDELGPLGAAIRLQGCGPQARSPSSLTITGTDASP